MFNRLFCDPNHRNWGVGKRQRLLVRSRATGSGYVRAWEGNDGGNYSSY